MHSGEFKTGRLDAFSDGVFAIVITLLVIELHIPEVEGGPHVSQELIHGLIKLLPKFISFIVSFAYIAIYWVNHHQLFHMVKKSDRGLFWLNSLFLMFLTFIPFPTALIGSYPHDPVAVGFYGVAMFFTAVSFVGMKEYIFASGLVDTALAKKPPFIYNVVGPLLYLIAAGLAVFNTSFAIAIYILIPVIYFFAGKEIN